MGWFNKKEKEVKEEPKVDPKLQELMDKHPRCFYKNDEGKLCWVRIIPERDEAFCKMIKDLSKPALRRIISELDRTSNFSCWCGQRNTPNKYQVRQVQDLVDYAFSTRAGLDWMMKKAIEGGIAQYNSDGEFEYLSDLKEEE